MASTSTAMCAPRIGGGSRHGERHALACTAPDLAVYASPEGLDDWLGVMRLHDHLDYLSSAEPDAEFVATVSRSITRADAAREIDRLAVRVPREWAPAR